MKVMLRETFPYMKFSRGFFFAASFTQISYIFLIHPPTLWMIGADLNLLRLSGPICTCTQHYFTICVLHHPNARVCVAVWSLQDAVILSDRAKRPISIQNGTNINIHKHKKHIFSQLKENMHSYMCHWTC